MNRSELTWQCPDCLQYHSPGTVVCPCGHTTELADERVNKRPTSVTIISWILIATSGIYLIVITATISSPIVRKIMGLSSIPFPINVVMNYVGSIIILLSGIAMLKGHRWARVLFVIWSLIGFVIGLFTTPVTATAVILNVSLLSIIIFFLFSAKADDFFSPQETSCNAEDI